MTEELISYLSEEEFNTYIALLESDKLTGQNEAIVFSDKMLLKYQHKIEEDKTKEKDLKDFLRDFIIVSIIIIGLYMIDPEGFMNMLKEIFINITNGVIENIKNQ